MLRRRLGPKRLVWESVHFIARASVALCEFYMQNIYITYGKVTTTCGNYRKAPRPARNISSHESVFDHFDTGR